MNRTKTVLLGASALAAGAVIAGGVNLATAATDDDESPGPRMGQGHGWGHDHTPVTGSERSKVASAVTGKYDDVTVRVVMKDEDGSYDVMGTRGGRPVRIEVSNDLGTVELRAPGRVPGMRGGPGFPGGPGGPGGMRGHTPVTGSEKADVVDAVTKKDKAVKVVAVLKEDDGSYDVMGVRGDEPVHAEVSKDLGTVELSTGGPGMGMRHGRGFGGPHGWGPPPGWGPRATPSTDT
ncbi:hypothetical protein [Nocardioides marmoribigeumensis]|uniref:PepSY domain-containing protein n=1 Tax=Nocardioides marmoribigeumensis TaxID=433649 RepID=A0ABU2BYC0_9ACTN|nr:hypothetical protein [Nocardioides marmoribigeumensis]MDR7363389.1 hypothetical protein [Nocardioides marmoribigeumensis]